MTNMDYLNDFVPGIFGTLKAESLKQFKEKARETNFIKPRGMVDFDPAQIVFKGEEAIISFTDKDGYDDFVTVKMEDELTAIEAFYIILKKQLEVNPRYCFLEAIEPVNKPVLKDGVLRRVPLFKTIFKR